ncbi:hypothetical protein [Nocardioides dongkuii]|uniref:hypothetical protein n=1 Tax=Nocardioides dongkuii TaxID=2760089 RepID=UPI0015FA69BA|nr:hypothetical protein [Nocardioides dongkuii]
MATLRTRPEGSSPIELEMPPRLASWNKVGDPERDRLDVYLSHVRELTAGYMTTDAPLALELQVGMGLRPLAHESDLDNYLEPVLRNLGANRFWAAFGTKHAEKHSTVAVGPTTPTEPPRGPDLFVEPLGSYEKRAWLLQIEDACAAADRLDPEGHGPVRLIVAYDLGPRRTWVNLWKPTIDALGPLLGTVPRPTKAHDDPRDGRITALELHRTVDPDAGNDIKISFWWDHLEPS